MANSDSNSEKDAKIIVGKINDEIDSNIVNICSLISEHEKNHLAEKKLGTKQNQ